MSTSRAARRSADDDEPQFTAENPLTGEISALVNLNGTGSTRETWHVEIAAEAPGFVYKPGDAIGVVAGERSAARAELAEAVGLGADGAVVQKLRERYDVTTLSRPLVEAYAKLTRPHRRCRSSPTPKAFTEFADDRQLIDLFERYPEKLNAGAAVRPAAPAAGPALLGGLQPRRRIPAKRICWSAPCAGNRTARSARASPRPTSPTAAGWAMRCASTSSRTATSACRRTATARSS